MVSLYLLITEPTGHFDKIEGRFSDPIGSVAVPLRLILTMSVQFVNRSNRFSNQTVANPRPHAYTNTLKLSYNVHSWWLFVQSIRLVPYMRIYSHKHVYLLVINHNQSLIGSKTRNPQFSSLYIYYKVNFMQIFNYTSEITCSIM